LFIARGGTKSETTLKIVNSIQREIAGMAKGDVTDEELGRAKDNILKGFAFEFDSTAEIVNRMITYEYFGYPRDYLQRYRDNIEKVTRADVARVAGKYLDTSRLAVLVLGKQKDFEQPVATLGKVVEIDITIPEPKQQALEAATPEAVEKGKGLLAAARKAMGGDAVAKVKDWVVVWKATFETPQGSVPINGESTTSVDGKMLQKMTTPMGEMAVGYDGRTAWMKMGANTREAPASEKGEIEGGIFRETFTLLQNFERLDVQALGDNEVAVSDPPRKQQVKLSLDPSTRMIVKKVFTASMMGPPAELEETYSDFRDVEGVKFPFKSVTTRSGKTVSEQTVTEVKLNPGVADSAYAKP
jgi:hypothetical protein